MSACSSERTSNACAVGSERCECYPNSTCNAGLACYSNRCVAPGSSGGNAGFGGQSTEPGGGNAGNTGLGGGGGGMVPEQGGSPTDAGATGEPASGGITSSGGGPSAGGSGGGNSAQGGTPTSGGSTGMTGGMGNSNLLSNGDFAQGEAHWKVESHNGGGISLSTSGQYCVRARGSLAFTIGYPGEGEPGVALTMGTQYVFSFRARASAAAEVEAKVGEVTAPYSAATSETVTLGNSFQTYTQEFDQPEGLGMMGLAFTGSLGADQELCLEDVSLTEKP